MILRRVIEHVREQNWTAVVIDFLIVVVGVFVAIEVSEWKANRATQARSEVFTARLTDDLRGEAWGWEYLVAYNADALASATVALAGLPGNPAVSDAAFLIGAYRATQLRHPQRWRSTYDELVSTGEIGLITDDTLRTMATFMYTSSFFDRFTEDGLRSTYRMLFRRLVPADVQHELLRSCGDRVVEPGDYGGVAGSLDYDCRLALSPEQIAAAAAALRSDPEVLPALQHRYADLEGALHSLTQDLGPQRAILQRIAGQGQGSRGA